jgi:predicted esterase
MKLSRLAPLVALLLGVHEAAGREEAVVLNTVRPDGAVSEILPAPVPEVTDDAVQRLGDRLEEMMKSSPHPLFTRHLLSVKSLVESEWARAQSLRLTDPAASVQVRDQAEKFLEAFAGDAGRWESYWRDGLPLCLTFVSKVDNTLQRYLVTLPSGWDPQTDRDGQKPFPLLVELHGHGDPNPVTNAANWLDLSEAPFAHLGRTEASRSRAGYHVLPHGRANSGYLGIGAQDVWEALADFQQSFLIDEDRQYLLGFSMGGGGTWRLALRSPDRWAAIALYAPSILQRGALSAALTENLHAMPVWIWTGGEDVRMADQAMVISQLRGFGNEAIANSSPGIAHEYPAEWQSEGVRWLLQHTRRPPARMVFVSDSDLHSGAWGIQMKRDPATEAWPRFRGRVEGNTVYLDTSDTPEVAIRLGEDGLGLSGDVAVMLNGREAYRGPAATITLPTKFIAGSAP